MRRPPDLSHLDDAFIQRVQEARHPHLAIEALRRLIEQEMRRVTRFRVVEPDELGPVVVASGPVVLCQVSGEEQMTDIGDRTVSDPSQGYPRAGHESGLFEKLAPGHVDRGAAFPAGTSSEGPPYR